MSNHDCTRGACSQRGFSRRDLLVGGMASMGALAVPRLGLSAWGMGAAEENDGDILVLLELAGGNDGLSTIVPHGDDAYHAARKITHLKKGDLLPLDEYRGFHPLLKSTRALWDQGELAIVEGVGYPNPNRSHFFSMEIWGTGSEKGKVSGDGWVGKLLKEAFGDKNPTRAIQFGGKLRDFMISSDHPILCMEGSASYRWATDSKALAGITGSMTGGKSDSIRARLGGVLDDASQSSQQVRETVKRYQTKVEYPDSSLGEALKTAAALIDGRIGARVVSATLPGFDTHANQKQVHDGLLDTYDQALGAFVTDLKRSERGRRATVLVFSEFGRRVAENGSRGTDHGAAAPVLVAGPRVKGGLYGAHPSLTDLVDGDMIYSTDFRQVYATLIEDLFHVDPTKVLPGKWETLPLIQA